MNGIAALNETALLRERKRKDLFDLLLVDSVHQCLDLRGHMNGSDRELCGVNLNNHVLGLNKNVGSIPCPNLLMLELAGVLLKLRLPFEPSEEWENIVSDFLIGEELDSETCIKVDKTGVGGLLVDDLITVPVLITCLKRLVDQHELFAETIAFEGTCCFDLAKFVLESFDETCWFRCQLKLILREISFLNQGNAGSHELDNGAIGSASGSKDRRMYEHLVHPQVSRLNVHLLRELRVPTPSYHLVEYVQEETAVNHRNVDLHIWTPRTLLQ